MKGGGVGKEKVTWTLLPEGRAKVRLRGGNVLVVRSSDAKCVDHHIESDIDEESMGSFFRYCQDLCTSTEDDREILAWMCKVVELEEKSEIKDWSQLSLRSTWSIPPPQWAVDRETAGEDEPQQDFKIVDEVQKEEVLKEEKIDVMEGGDMAVKKNEGRKELCLHQLEEVCLQLELSCDVPLAGLGVP